MLTNTRHFLAQSHATRDVYQQQLQFATKTSRSSSITLTSSLLIQNSPAGATVSTSGKKREMKIEFRLLSDILAKTISVKAGLPFNIFKDMVTPGSKQAKGYAIQICLLLINVPHLALGDSKEFHASKILTAKTVRPYIAVVDKSEVEDVSWVKKTPLKRAVSRKRPATVDEPVVKKKRTCVGKASAVTASPALEAVPVTNRSFLSPQLVIYEI
ncbi:hypothetical protein F511_15606 [Dorcoceras hygrometricum]|uniref:Uncharacterized protein n=1 Tax=Dorcoceras hygrometricum TaxID=472368 RepID=A0A2Z7B9F2_9LAMI|nr:hypothetical protein F511_15606 [Dorcoceras hygrometricum]